MPFCRLHENLNELISAPHEWNRLKFPRVIHNKVIHKSISQILYFPSRYGNTTRLVKKVGIITGANLSKCCTKCKAHITNQKRICRP